MGVGFFAIIIQGCIKVGGFNKVIQVAQEHGRIDFFQLGFFIQTFALELMLSFIYSNETC